MQLNGRVEIPCFQPLQHASYKRGNFTNVYEGVDNPNILVKEIRNVYYPDVGILPASYTDFDDFKYGIVQWISLPNG